MKIHKENEKENKSVYYFQLALPKIYKWVSTVSIKAAIHSLKNVNVCYRDRHKKISPIPEGLLSDFNQSKN